MKGNNVKLSLRSRLIEAIAKAVRLQEHGVDGPLDEVSKQRAAFVLDAFLDVLEAEFLFGPNAVDLVAVLRDGGDEED